MWDPSGERVWWGDTHTFTITSYSNVSFFEEPAPPDPVEELSRELRRRLGRQVEPDDLRERRWQRGLNRMARCLANWLALVRARDAALASLARRRRRSAPRPRPERSRRRTCGASSSRSARPPVAVS